MTVPRPAVEADSSSWWHAIVRRFQRGLEVMSRWGYISVSADYRAWQRQFLRGRLRLCLWVALLCNLSFAVVNIDNLVLNPDAETVQQAIAILGDPKLFERLKSLLLMSDWATMLCLVLCLGGRRTPWGIRHPEGVFLAISWSMTLIPELFGTILGLPVPGSWDFVFMAQVVLVPVNWPLHFLSQLVSILYYFGVNAAFKLTKIPGAPGLFNLETISSAIWICLICNVAVYWYDRLQYQEFESRRELRLFLHAVTHDLRTPVIGMSIVLKNLLHKAETTDGKATITTPKLEKLLAGSDRQLRLINSILEAHHSETQPLVLHCQSLQFSTLVESVLIDLDNFLTENQVSVTNHLTASLPPIHADATQIWRVLTNLIINAVKHNPAGIHLTFDGIRLDSMLRITIHDTGVGIPPQQQARLFELYYRGAQSRYTPGLGLGLYLCHQIITAHGGQVGVVSQPAEGTTFWFTLPIVQSNQP
jgi:signal transduction histidine kinase